MAVDRREHPLPARPSSACRERMSSAERHERVLLAERDVAGARDRPRPAVAALELLLRAHAVDRQLQRARWLRRPAELVVDDPQRAVGQQVDAIRLGLESAASRGPSGR